MDIDADKIDEAVLAENVQRDAVGFLVQCCLHLGSQRVGALPHVGDAARQIDPSLTSRKHHRPSRMVSSPRNTFRSAPGPMRTATKLVVWMPNWERTASNVTVRTK